jgi:hypothetical protein
VSLDCPLSAWHPPAHPQHIPSPRGARQLAHAGWTNRARALGSLSDPPAQDLRPSSSPERGSPGCLPQGPPYGGPQRTSAMIGDERRARVAVGRQLRLGGCTGSMAAAERLGACCCFWLSTTSLKPPIAAACPERERPSVALPEVPSMRLPEAHLAGKRAVHPQRARAAARMHEDSTVALWELRPRRGGDETPRPQAWKNCNPHRGARTLRPPSSLACAALRNPCYGGSLSSSIPRPPNAEKIEPNLRPGIPKTSQSGPRLTAPPPDLVPLLHSVAPRASPQACNVVSLRAGGHSARSVDGFGPEPGPIVNP